MTTNFKELVGILHDSLIEANVDDKQFDIIWSAINDVHSKLRIYGVVGQSEQLNIIKTNPNFKEWLKGFEKIGEKHYRWGKGYIINIEEMEEKHIELVKLNI